VSGAALAHDDSILERCCAALRPRGSAALLCLLALSACRQDMHDQPKYQPFERNAFFADQRASRPLVPGVVARGHLDEDTAFFTGSSGGAPVQTSPLGLGRDVLLRGQERYDIYCSPCHDRTGSGRGMIVQRGFPRAASYHEQRLRDAPPGYFFNAMTNGFGVMPSYATQIPVDDRWAIVAYIRALQLSQHASLEDVEPLKRALLSQSGDVRE